MLCLRSNATLAATDPTEFANTLVDTLGVKHLVVGDDFRFGKDRQGDFALLKTVGTQRGFSVATHPTVEAGDQRISSTLIRELLAAGKLGEAAGLLGQPFRVTGRVTHGEKLGRQLGFPTANIPLRRSRSPLAGVYVVTVEGLADEGLTKDSGVANSGGARGPRQAIANVGRRPTVNGQRDQLEVHLLDYQGDLYGQRLTISFLAKLRGEQKFASLEALKTQIATDVELTRAWFAANDPG